MLFVCYPRNEVPAKEGPEMALDESGRVEYHVARDIKTDNPTAEELKTWWKIISGPLPLKRFLQYQWKYL